MEREGVDFKAAWVQDGEEQVAQGLGPHADFGFDFE